MYKWVSFQQKQREILICLLKKKKRVEMKTKGKGERVTRIELREMSNHMQSSSKGYQNYHESTKKAAVVPATTK